MLTSWLACGRRNTRANAAASQNLTATLGGWSCEVALRAPT